MIKWESHQKRCFILHFLPESHGKSDFVDTSSSQLPVQPNLECCLFHKESLLVCKKTKSRNDPNCVNYLTVRARDPRQWLKRLLEGPWEVTFQVWTFLNFRLQSIFVNLIETKRFVLHFKGNSRHYRHDNWKFPWMVRYMDYKPVWNEVLSCLFKCWH